MCLGGSIKRSFCWSSKLRLYTWFLSLSQLFFLTISLHHQIFLQREKEREKLTMAVSRKWACVFSAVLLLLFVGVMPTTSGTNGGIAALTRSVETEKVQSSSNTTMAARSQEEADALNEKAVADNPEEKNRKRLADCGIGFGRNAIGGRDGRFYVVTDPSDNDPVNPRPGTLRHAVIQDAPLWIVFKRDMVIQLKQELIMNSFKTIDGRGVNVHIANGGCITIQFVTNVIIHGLHIHDCKPTGNAMVRSSPSHYGWRTMADGDAVSIFGSSHIWVDHNSLSHCADGLVDAVMGSTAITVSNNHFTHHNEVMLLGHSDSYIRDKQMQVTIAYNHFGEGLIQRMPSAEPTINSQGNRYNAPVNPFAKEVTKRVDTAAGYWKNWNWRSEGDLLLNGAYFTPSGAGASSSYARASSLGAKSSSMVGAMTANAGALGCRGARQC
ncbi:pectate lyase 1 [Populus alba x Populus x berolinensis]|nr:pectate lyase 1 [Populus alba x Populus x berolinensis]